MRPSKQQLPATSKNGAPAWIRYHRMDLKFTGKSKRARPELEPILREEKARVVIPESGLVVRGILVDCPETGSDNGCVVIDTDTETLAMLSRALQHLMIEHAPCHLEFVAVSIKGQNGMIQWDWEAYELSPHGARIRVSDLPEESDEQ